MAPAVVRGDEFSAEYETADGKRHVTRWVKDPEDTVDLVGYQGGVIRSMYERNEAGEMFRTYGGHRVEYTGGDDVWDRGLRALLREEAA